MIRVFACVTSATRLASPNAPRTASSRELADAGYITRERNGRRNHYEIQADLRLPDPLARGKKVGDLLAILAR